MQDLVVGQTLTKIDIHSGRYTKKLPDGYSTFPLPLKVSALTCKGKFIYFKFGDQWSIWNTLGMTGSWGKKFPMPDKVEFLRMSFHFADIDPIYFSDMRNFGTMKFCSSFTELQEKLDSLGPDILKEDMSNALFRTKLKNRAHKTLPEILMDQGVISGIGNYIKAESLYLAKVSPHRKAGSLTDEEIVQLNKAIHLVIRESYKTGGSTFRTYSDFNGDVGTFTDRFMVYGRKEDPLGNPVVKEETLDKRTTHWVPKVQK